MIKKIIISVCFLFSIIVVAQEGTSSPYSFYGIGDIRFKGAIENQSMGGVAIEQDSIHMNLENPASFSNLKLTTFTTGFTYAAKTLKEGSQKANTRRTSLDYLAVGLPLGKLGIGFGLIPYSSVGYKIESLSTDTDPYNRRYTGTGGVNKAFFGLGYKLAPGLSLGADAQYNFGRIETSSIEIIDGVASGTRELNEANLSGVNFSFGAMYQAKINKKLSFFSSINYTLESDLTSQNNRNIATVLYNSDFEVSSVDLLDEEKEEKTLKLPSKLIIGAGIGESKKWLVGAQLTMGDVGDLENSYNARTNVSYEKSIKYSVGGYYIPNYNSFSSYAKRIVYRAGLKYEQTGLVVNSESINDTGVSLGLGFPITGTFSNINLGFDLGKRGTTSSGLVQENYVNFRIGFSFNDRWFEKRKFQ